MCWYICIKCLYLNLTGHFLPLMPTAGDLALHRSRPGVPAQVASGECHAVQQSDDCSPGLDLVLSPPCHVPCNLGRKGDSVPHEHDSVMLVLFPSQG